MSTMQAFLDRIVPVFGWPRSVYSDNGAHFTGTAIWNMWKDHGVSHFTAAISHPQSVGLSERYVQMTMGRVRLKCITMGSSANWGLLVKDALIDINTRCIRIHGYTPAEILLGYNPASSQHEIIAGDREVVIGPGRNWIQSGEVEVPEEDTIHVGIDRRDERGTTAMQKLARSQDLLNRRATPGSKWPRAGDLVLVRDIQLAKEKGKKLEPRWSTPRILERISKSEVSGHVRQLHDPPNRTKRYHLDDLIPYASRTNESFPSVAVTAAPAVEYARDALGNVQGSWSVGQRSFDLSDIGRESR